MLVSRGSPGVSRRWGELSEGASDENDIAPEASGASRGPRRCPLIVRVNDVYRQPTRRCTPARDALWVIGHYVLLEG